MKEPEPDYQPPTTAFEIFLRRGSPQGTAPRGSARLQALLLRSLPGHCALLLGDVLHFDALEKTSSELLEELQSYP